MEQELIKEVKRMNGFLEAIDWKLWEIYKKMSGTTASTPGDITSAVPVPSTVAPVKVEEPEQVATPVIPVPSYPNIEKWK